MKAPTARCGVWKGWSGNTRAASLRSRTAARRARKSCRGSTRGQPRLKSLLDLQLLPRVKLGAPRSQIEDVDHSLPFRIDQRHFDVAAELGQSGADLVKQAGPVVGDELQQCAVGRGDVIKADLGRDHHLGPWRLGRSAPPAHQGQKARLAGQHVADALLETLELARVQFQGAKKID